MKMLIARRGSDQPVIAELDTHHKLDTGDVRVAPPRFAPTPKNS